MESTVSQEFLNPKYLRANFGEFIDSLKSFFDTRDDVTTDIGRVPHYGLVRRRLEKVSYASMRETKVFVPAGLNVQYKTYLAVIGPSIKMNEELLTHILTPFARWLSDNINDPTKLKAISHSSTIRDFEPHNLDSALEEVGECFDKGSNQNKIPFKDAFARNADVKEVMEVTERLTSRFIAIDRKQVTRKVDEISENLDLLITRLEEEDSDYDIDKGVETLLAQMTYTVAREVEFYGAMAYQLTQLTTALNNTVDEMR